MENDEFDPTVFDGKRIVSAEFDPNPDFNILKLTFDDGSTVSIKAFGGHGGCGMLSFESSTHSH